MNCTKVSYALHHEGEFFKVRWLFQDELIRITSANSAIKADVPMTPNADGHLSPYPTIRYAKRLVEEFKEWRDEHHPSLPTEFAEVAS